MSLVARGQGTLGKGENTDSCKPERRAAPVAALFRFPVISGTFISSGGRWARPRAVGPVMLCWVSHGPGQLCQCTVPVAGGHLRHRIEHTSAGSVLSSGRGHLSAILVQSLHMLLAS